MQQLKLVIERVASAEQCSYWSLQGCTWVCWCCVESTHQKTHKILKIQLQSTWNICNYYECHATSCVNKIWIATHRNDDQWKRNSAEYAGKLKLLFVPVASWLLYFHLWTSPCGDFSVRTKWADPKSWIGRKWVQRLELPDKFTWIWDLTWQSRKQAARVLCHKSMHNTRSMLLPTDLHHGRQLIK